MECRQSTQYLLANLASETHTAAQKVNDEQYILECQRWFLFFKKTAWIVLIGVLLKKREDAFWEEQRYEYRRKKALQKYWRDFKAYSDEVQRSASRFFEECKEQSQRDLRRESPLVGASHLSLFAVRSAVRGRSVSLPVSLHRGSPPSH